MMPLYEYMCEKCEEKVECLLTLANAQATPFFCPKCGERMTILMISEFAQWGK